jgi:hypothetical protein
MTLQRSKAERCSNGIDLVHESTLSQWPVTVRVAICEEVTVRGWVIDSELIVQFRNGIDWVRLCSTVNVLAVLGTFSTGNSEDCNLVAVTVCLIANI